MSQPTHRAKLLITSVGLSVTQAKELMRLVGKTAPAEVQFALIENAADTYEEEKKAWMYRDRNSYMSHGFTIDFVDLNEYRHGEPGLAERLGKADVIWFGGGNVYYIRWLLKEVGADELVIELAHNGKVVGGSSAGSIVVGPTLRFFEPADQPELVPELIMDGLNITNVVSVPHWQNEKYGQLMIGINENLQKAGYTTVCLTDSYGLVVDADTQHMIR